MTATIRNRTDRLHAAQRTRAGHVEPAPLTDDQYEAARLGHPGLTPDEAAYYVHESERYIYDLELWSRDAMPEDWDAQYRYERQVYAEQRRESERRRLPGKRWVAARDAEWATCPF